MAGPFRGRSSDDLTSQEIDGTLVQSRSNGRFLG